jgi:hypothetical protein
VAPLRMCYVGRILAVEVERRVILSRDLDKMVSPVERLFPNQLRFFVFDPVTCIRTSEGITPFFSYRLFFIRLYAPLCLIRVTNTFLCECILYKDL